jgi:hypothetical protein
MIARREIFFIRWLLFGRSIRRNVGARKKFDRRPEKPAFLTILPAASGTW